ncbi:MAG: GTP pyrophosphokinase [Verrucomicrobia bacterium]|nr:GTP pyrophosphokinase [Verrucomicrobiota bacterium]
MATTEKALQIAVRAHAGQQDKSGAAYIFHPLRVMARCRSEDARIVALLHDVVEDTAVTFDELVAAGFSEPVLAAIRLLTHRGDVPYLDYVRAIAANPLATEVKLADLEDNSDLRRLRQVDDKAVQRMQKYHRAWQILTGADRR